MIYSVNSSKSLPEIDQAIREAAQRHKFGILNVLDLKQTLGNKGIDLNRECRVHDVCNPQAASKALNADMSASVVLPCRIAVFAGPDATTWPRFSPRILCVRPAYEESMT